jgi:hypothetical protein
MRILLALAVVGLCDCRAHVDLGTVPDENAPLHERVAAYEELAPARYQMLPAWGPQTRLVLRNGVVVDDAIDLAPAVKHDSATLRLARESEAYDEATRWTWMLAGAVATIGLAGEIGAGAIASDSTLTDDQRITWLWVTGGFAGLGIIGAVAMAPAGILTYQSQRAKGDAFAAYDRDLQKKLALKKKTPPVTEWDDARLSALPDPVNP